MTQTWSVRVCLLAYYGDWRGSVHSERDWRAIDVNINFYFSTANHIYWSNVAHFVQCFIVIVGDLICSATTFVFVITAKLCLRVSLIATGLWYVPDLVAIEAFRIIEPVCICCMLTMTTVAFLIGVDERRRFRFTKSALLLWFVLFHRIHWWLRVYEFTAIKCHVHLNGDFTCTFPWQIMFG